MKRASGKKSVERRKRPRKKTSSTPSKTLSNNSPSLTVQSGKDSCLNCSKSLTAADQKVLFVEEEVGRTFCSETCISGYFSPEVERLEKEYFRWLSGSDLTGEERESLAHLRWITLQEPDEVWREKTLSGDYRFTLISEFQPENKRIWCVCICLFLRGEPSFLYLAFPTRNAAMANHYRRGEKMSLNELQAEVKKKKKTPSESHHEIPMDGLATAWTDDELLRAQMIQERNPNDIPPEDFALYQGYFEETLEEPDEVWSIHVKGELSPRLYHFIRHYPDETPGVWFIVVAREVEDEEQIEILDAFPTKDISFVERYRQGDQEIGAHTQRPNARVIH